MSEKKLTGNKEYIEGPAGINDSFTINGVHMKQIFKGNEEKATKKNAMTVTPNSVQREVVSTELELGMTIKAENGGKPKSRDEETR